MSKWLGVIIGALLFGGQPALAESTWSITRFASDIVVHPDATIHVTEHISTTFDGDKHGIFRDIPWRYTTDQNTNISVPLVIEEVSLDNQPEPYEQSIQGNNVRLKIGRSDKTITGQHIYAIRYQAKAAVNFFADHDELYWNVTGHDWEVPITNVHATIHLPGPVATDQLQAKCFTGQVGSTLQRCQTDITPSTATVTATDITTVVVGWPKGVVTKPTDYDQLRQQNSPLEKPATPRPPWVTWLLWAGNILVPLLGGIGLWRWWLKHGRDPTSSNTLVVQYDPPANLTPADMAAVVTEQTRLRDVNATMIDLAVRGYLKISEVAKKKLLSWRVDRDYTLTSTKPWAEDQTLNQSERLLLQGLFSDRTEVRLSTLAGTFSDTIQKVRDSVYTEVVRQGYFVSNPKERRTMFEVIGLSVLVGGFFAFHWHLYTIPVVGLCIIIFARAMPKRTAAGVQAFRHAQGFKEYLSRAEKYRLQWQERENIFEKFLPYAMVFGVAEKWSKAFADLDQPKPTWYKSNSRRAFNSLVLWSSLDTMTNLSAKSFAPPAASGNSGFGSSGFSGGGFGGGGGGSW